MANETTENELNETGEPGTEYFMETLPGQDRYVAPLDETPLQDVDSVDESAPATSMWADAWRTLRRNPLFIISGLLILFIIVVAATCTPAWSTAPVPHCPSACSPRY